MLVLASVGVLGWGCGMRLGSRCGGGARVCMHWDSQGACGGGWSESEWVRIGWNKGFSDSKLALAG